MTMFSTLVPGETVWISATVRNNISPIYVAQLMLTTGTDIAFEETDYNEVWDKDFPTTNLIPIFVFQTIANISFTDLPSEMKPGKIYDITFDVTVPPNSSMYAITEITLPVDESAVMTVLDMSLVSYGCLSNYQNYF